ncbi:MAG: hypothetical protein A2051_12805 [Desulfovibrionales bacterium GWA2_65_9]|nr:MAG: hypothetical protein A2051_12805 [Desulfovibrionales bacterium GWA2_65_9]
MEDKEKTLEVLPDTSQGQEQRGTQSPLILQTKTQGNETGRNADQLTEPRPSAPGKSQFVSNSEGVLYREFERNSDESRLVWFSSPLDVIAQTRDANGEWGLYLAVQNPLGETLQWVMPMSMMAGTGSAYREALLRMGLKLGVNGSKRLYEYLMTARPERFLRCMHSTGWHGPKFVLPDSSYGPENGEEIIHQGPTSETPFRVKGALGEWQDEIGRLGEGNSRLALALSSAFLGPLLQPFGQESGGFHFTGNSSVGKSTLLMAAGSVCGGGGPAGFVRSWRTTDNSLEAIAPMHNDALLCLDELGQVAPSAAANIAYMLANGQGKGRARKDGSSRPMHFWRTVFLSTGELTFEQKVREDKNQRFMAGQSVRIVDILADAGKGMGAFETLHGFIDGKAFSEHLNRVSVVCYGAPFRRYLELLTADLANFVVRARTWLQRFESEACPQHADGQVKRVAKRFGLAAAAGELAVEMGILPWRSGSALWACTVCFWDWVASRGGFGSAEAYAALARVRDFLAIHGASRFETWGKEDGERIANRAGYRRNEGENVLYLVYPGVFKSELCNGGDHKIIARHLLERGHLVPGKNQDFAKVHKLSRERTTARFYTIKASILADNLEDSPFEETPNDVTA